MRRHLVAILLLGGWAAIGPAQVIEPTSTSVQGPYPATAVGYPGVWNGYGPEYGDPVACGAGGFGECGGCGVGGYLGRNIHPVSPCVCGGSLCLDMLRGVKGVLDQTVSCAVGTVFGGLHVVSCHTRSSLAAIRCAALAGCPPCGSTGYGGCGGACCGMMGSEGYFATPVHGTPTYALPEGPIEVPEEVDDPFTDDPEEAPEDSQARHLRQPVGTGYARPAAAAALQRASYPHAVGDSQAYRRRAAQPSILKTSRTTRATLRNPFLQRRPVTLRR